QFFILTEPVTQTKPEKSHGFLSTGSFLLMSIHQRRLARLRHPPPLYTRRYPFAISILLADALRIPDAQQTTTGDSGSGILRRFAASSCKGILTDPRMCPVANSAFVRTSIIGAPALTSPAKS